MNGCKKCNEPVDGNYCPVCGRPATLKKIDGRYIMNEIGDVLFVNSGLLYTIKSLIIKPGETVRHYIREDRSRLVRPVTFLVITSLIYAIVNYFFTTEMKDNSFFINPFINAKVEGLPAVTFIFRWMAENFAYSNIITGLFMAFGVKIFFRKINFNLFEIFIFLCFANGISTLFLSLGSILQSITHWDLIKISSLVSMIYLIWATGQFMNRKKVASYIKSFLSYVAGSLIFAAFIVLIGIIVDFVTGSL